MTVLNKSQGNMFEFVTHTWNPIGGHCSHECPYCYMQGFQRFKAHAEKYGGDPRVIPEALGDLGRDHSIFVANCTDLFAANVSEAVIRDVLAHCSKYHNEYLFLTKNPGRYIDFIDSLPNKSILGATIESDMETPCKAPQGQARLEAMRQLAGKGRRRMISIEPVIKFSGQFSRDLVLMDPDFVAVGANTGRYRLIEPDAHEVTALIQALEGMGIPVIRKPNLARITGAVA